MSRAIAPLPQSLCMVAGKKTGVDQQAREHAGHEMHEGRDTSQTSGVFPAGYVGE